jgi:hypothetical protein
MASFLDCTINVEDIQAGATVPAADAAAAAAPNGLTIGDGNLEQFVASDITNQATVNYTLKTVEYVGGQGASPVIILSNKGSGITRLTTLLKTSGIKWVLTGGEPETAELVLSEAYKQPDATFLSGYPTGDASEEGLLRGDGQASALSINELLPALEAGQLHGLLVTTKLLKGVPDYAQLSKIPVLSTYVSQHVPKSKNAQAALKGLEEFEEFPSDMIFASKGTPPKYVAALTEAYKYAMKKETGELNYLEQSPKFIPPATLLKDLNSVTTPAIESLMRPYFLG